MDAGHFDRLTRAFSAASSRRQALLAILLGGARLAHGMEDAEAGPGCKNVGKTCKKKKDCCSGVCKGKKGKKKCKAHDSGGCQAGQSPTGCGGDADVPCTSTGGEEGFCHTTTGNAGYCAVGGDCFPCSKDADCREVCGPAAACVRCEADCPDTGGTGCVGPSECPGFPD